MLSTTLTLICSNCDVEKEVHRIDGCPSPAYQKVRVCVKCAGAPGECDCQ